MPDRENSVATTDIWAGVATLYVDANILIYLIEGRGETREKVTRILAEATSNGISLATSEITLAECLYGAFKQDNDELASVYRQVLSGDGLMQPIPCHLALFEEAARTGANHSLKLIDAIHVAAALQFECDAFLTNDTGIRLPETMKVIHLSGLA
jgi:predicted nucleic acid-binding protein